MQKRHRLIIFLLFVTAVSMRAQMDKKYYLGAHFSYGKASYSRSVYQSSTKGKNFFSFGFDYTQNTSESTDFCVGLCATLYGMDISSTTSGLGTSHNDGSFGIFSVPISVKCHFGKYFYIDVGASFNYHPYYGYTWGLGGLGGVGAEYSCRSGLAFSIAPQIQYNALSLGKNRDLSDDNLVQFGVNIGVGYRF